VATGLLKRLLEAKSSNGATMTKRIAITILSLLVLSAEAYAQSCLQSPTSHNLVVGRFGDPAGGGDGLLFSAGGSAKPLFAAGAGQVVFMGSKGEAGNVISIRLGNGDVISYEKVVGFSISTNPTVTAGQQIGVASGHVKVTYAVATKDLTRLTSLQELTALPGAFNPGQLPYAFNNDVGYKTDPSPYFCQSFPIDDGQPSRDAIIGGDTKTQFNLMIATPPTGGVSLGAGLDAAQVTAANIKVALSNHAGKTQLEFLTDTDGFGTLPTPPAGAYENMSVNEMMLTEAVRRFRDAEWNNKLTQVSSRALWVDYAKATGVSNFLDDAIYRKKERIEALLAVYSSMKMKGIKAETTEAHQGALSEKSRNDIH
jgi:murein DD-endopeptidase